MLGGRDGGTADVGEMEGEGDKEGEATRKRKK